MPFGITTDISGNIWVADTGNNRIRKFGNTGTFLAGFGSFGTDNGLFKSPTGIAADSSGNVYVTDKDNNRIQKFSGDGTVMSVWGGYGSTDGLFIQPWGIVLDNAGSIYVADRDNHRIQKFMYFSPIIALSGDMAFGSVYLGSSAQKTLTISNIGNSPLTVYSISCPTGFSGNWSGTIAAGAYQNVTVTFTPTAAQTYSGTIAVSSDKTLGTETIAVSGTGIPIQTGISAIRSFPSCYLAGSKLTVSLSVQPSSGIGLYAVEDRQPSGWTVSNISDSGVYDAVSGKIKFGPFSIIRAEY
ncbi:MAG: choice-of-anchor D domain-containing protein [Desulfobacteraceae bacterium]|nr:choice-of-anchor D domain-containing protein [Desulfobacteraceae bacterium]